MASERGFTLVEVIVALGIFAFAIMGVVFLLGTGLTSARESRRDTALSAALLTASARIHSASNSLVATTNYFDLEGNWLANSNNSIYQFTIRPLGNSATFPTNWITSYSVTATGPLPQTHVLGRFTVTRSR